MQDRLDVVRGELERLFSISNLRELCTEYLGVDAAEAGIADESKAVFARRLIEWCERSSAIEALADSMMLVKKGMVDPRAKQVYLARYRHGPPAADAITDFRLGELIGEDGVGAVWECHPGDAEAGDKRRFAAWIIHGEHALDAAAVQRFLAQMRVLRRVDNESIQPVERAGLLPDGRPYTVIRWLEGSTLASLSPLPPASALVVFSAVLEALDAVHSLGLAHADLRPENVLVRKPEAEGAEIGSAGIVLLGLGVDKLFHKPEPPGPGGAMLALGMVKNLAPELARGTPVDVRSDIYSLGTLLFEAITGKPVFQGRFPADVLAAHLTKSPPEAGSLIEEPLPGLVGSFIARLLAKSPAQRPRDIAEVRKELVEARRAAEEAAARAAQTGTFEDIETWADALIEDPGDEEVLEELFRETRRCNAWGAAVQVLEEAAAISDDVQVGRRLLLAAANNATRYLKDYDRAGELLTQLQEANPDDEEIADAVLRLFRAEGRFETLIEKLAAKAEAMDSDLERLAVIREIAAVYETELKEPAKAFDYYLACLGAGIEEELVERLERLAGRTDRLEDLATSCAPIVAAAEQEDDTEGAVYLYRKLGGWYLERLEQPTYALTCFQKVLECAPTDTAALEAMADLYRGAQQWKELAEVLVRLGEAESSPARGRDRLAAAARTHYEKLSETDVAEELLGGVLAEDPAHEDAGALLALIHEKAGKWEQLAALLARKVDGIAAGPEQAAARVRLGEVHEDRLNDLKSAREQFDKARAADPKNLDALKGLERICARQSDHAGLSEVLQQELELAITPRQRVLLLERLAEIDEEEFRDDAKAIERYLRIREIDAAHASALIVLTRLYRRTGAFEDLARILEERAALSDDEEKRALLHERAEVIREDIGDAQRAAAAFAELASQGAGDDALDALARSQEDAGDYAAADETLGKMVEAAKAPEQKIALMLRRAKLQSAHLEDHGLAAGTLRKARDLAPGDRSLITELVEVYQRQGNYSAALSLLEEDLELVEGSNARAEIYARMGLVSLENLKDEDKAIGYFEHALAIDKHNLVSGDNVSTLYRKRGQWEKALPIYELHAASSGVLEDEKRIELFTQMGEAYDHLGRRDDALASFRKAAELASEPRLMRRLGEVALGLGEHAMAREQFSRYLEAEGSGIDIAEKVAVQVMLGRACMAAGDGNEAAKLARQATVMAPDDNAARLLLAEVHEERGDFRGAVEARQRVLQSMAPGDDGRLGLVRKTANLMFEKLRDSEGASRLLTEEIEHFPEDRDVLGDLLKIYYATKRYADVVEVVLRIADLVDDPGQLARYYLTVAKIYRRELKQLDESLNYFEMAIEQDPSLIDAEESLVEILAEREDWERLEKHYKKAIARLPTDALPEEKLDVYRPLADLLLDKLDRERDGIMITEAMYKLAPHDATCREKLAGLYGWRTEYAEKAVPLHRLMLEENPARVESFRSLYRIFSAAEEPDQAWCAASMLALLNQASPEERTYYREYQPEDVPTMQSRLKDEHWNRQLFHHELNQGISVIFSVVGKAIAKAKSQPLSKFGLSAADAVDPAKDDSDFCRFLNFAAGTLGFDAPPVFFQESQDGGSLLIDTDPPVLVVGRTARKLKDRLGLAFALGQQLTLLRPGLFVNRLLSSGTEMSSWLLASIKIFVPGLPVPADLAGPVQERLSPIREALSEVDLEKLQGYVQTFVSKAADVNLKRWARAVDRTGDRAGLLLTGDVAVAVRMLKEQIEDKAQLSSRLRDLTLFTVSDEHHALRSRLGTALKNG